MSGINADWTQVGLYDYVIAQFDKYHLSEREQINTTVWDGLAHHFVNVSIGKLPITWQHLLLQQAKEQTSSVVSSYTRRTQGLLSRYKNMLQQEGSDRIAAEQKLMDDLGLVQHQVDKNGRDIKTQLVSMKNFEEHMTKIQSFADDMSNWVRSSGSGVIQANPNWQEPVSLSASTNNGGHMYFSGDGLIFTDSDGETLRGGLDSEGRIYADAIKAGTIEAVNIKSCLVESALTIGTDGGSMNIYIGTKNPGSILSPSNGGNVIWAMSQNYQSMFSSGKIAVTDGQNTTRIHPNFIEINDAHVITTDNINYWIKQVVTPSAIKDALGVPADMHVVYDGSNYSHLTDYIREHIPAKYRRGV